MAEVEKDKRLAYQVVLSRAPEGGYTVFIPDFGSHTEGDDLADAIYMARDAISLLGITMEDDGEKIPAPGTHPAEKEHDDDIITYVDVDFDEYRRKEDQRMVKKNVTIPSYMNEAAKAKGINFSRVLQDALEEIISA